MLRHASFARILKIVKVVKAGCADMNVHGPEQLRRFDALETYYIQSIFQGSMKTKSLQTLYLDSLQN